MIGDLLEGRTAEHRVLILGWYRTEKGVSYICIDPTGLTEIRPHTEVSIDWHLSDQGQWIRDAEAMGDDGEDG